MRPGIFSSQAGWAVCVALLLLTTLSQVHGREPCQVFEGGRVDPEIIEVMRGAALEGRLYRVVPRRSTVGFCVRHFPFQEFRGEFTDIIGGLTMPTMSDPRGKALLLIQTTPLTASNEDLAPVVTGKKFMDTARYPEILFVGRKFEWLAPLRGFIHGDLTLRGRTQPVRLQVSIDVLKEHEENQPGRVLLTGTGRVNRYQFDMRSHRFVVSDSVRLCLSVEMEQWKS